MDFICKNSDFFKNPNNLPLNELQLEVHLCKKKSKVPKEKDLEKIKDELGKIYHVKVEKTLALDQFWIQNHHSYYKYQPYYSEVSKEENDAFLTKNEQFLGNLKFLLQCTYHQFWNYVIYETRIPIILRSFITNPIPWYEIKCLDGEFLKLYTEIFKNVADVYLRLLTFKESDKEYMSGATVMKYLQEQDVVNYTDVMNLYLLYNGANRKLIIRLNEVFFCDRERGRYSKELRKILDHTLLAFEMVGGQICGFEDNSVLMPIGIRAKPAKFDPYWVEEVSTYLLDMSATLNAFLSNCIPACEMALKMGLPVRLSYFYNNVYATLYTMLKDRNLPFNWTDLRMRIFDHIGIGRSEFINTFHIFITHLIDNIIQTLDHSEKQEGFFEIYLKLITESLEDEFFIFDYHNSHQIDVQIQTITDFYPDLDHMRTDYIVESLCTLPTLENLLSKKREVKEIEQESLPIASTSSLSNVIENVDVKPDDAKIDDIIKSVLDTLPYLGDGFILQCLEAYNYNPADVISSILDENLPPHLASLPRDSIRVPPEPKPVQPILAYRGKRPDYKDAGALLNDKASMQDVKDFVLKAGTTFDMYDDEYDERYDEEPTHKIYGKKDVEKRFEGYELVSDPSESSSDESKPEHTKPKDAFCENPADIRERKEAYRKMNSRGRNQDVTGEPKGQGQDKNVVNNREKKNINKSSKGNHNRRSGAQWKRSKGMIPS